MYVCIYVCAHYVSVEKHKASRKAAREKIKRQAPTSKTNVTLWNLTVLCNNSPADCFTRHPFVTEARQQRAVLYHTSASCEGSDRAEVVVMGTTF